MIKNDFQLGVTRGQIRQLKESIDFILTFEGTEEISKPEPEELELGINTVNDQISVLEQEVAEYLKLKNGTKAPAYPKNITQVGEFVIQLRIAANLTQAELAKLVHTKTQVIQRYEANDYATASISRVNEIVKALEAYRKEHRQKAKSARAG